MHSTRIVVVEWSGTLRGGALELLNNLTSQKRRRRGEEKKIETEKRKKEKRL